MANVIVNRVKEFLRRFPPFSFLSEPLLLSVAREVEVQFYAKGDFLFHKDDLPRKHFFIVKEGSIHLTEKREGKSVVLEFCDEGDVFGVLALLGKRPYILDACAAEDSLVYGIPVSVFEKILEENQRVSLYFAAGFASGQVVVRTDLSQSQKARKLFSLPSQDNGLLIFTGQSDLNYSKNVLTCEVGISVGEAAKMMKEKDVSSIIITDTSKFPIGIITDKDIRNRLVAEGKNFDIPVESIMTQPVMTMQENSGFSTLYLAMIKNRLHHLIITADGTDKSPITGILSDHDILLSQGNSPSVIIHALLNTLDVKEMAKLRDKAEILLSYYLENEVAMDFVANIISEINDLIIKRAILIAKEKHDPAHPAEKNTKFCFLSLGSEGREEQLLRTDLDNALVFEDVPTERLADVKSYFLLLAEEVIEILLACGFHPCPADMMANNPRWCLPLSEWKGQFSSWILSPNQEALMHATIFFDFRAIAGQKDLAEALSFHIYDQINEKKIFLNFFAKNALLNPPPLGFFRDFIVEKTGEHRDKFDIKLRAMMPLADAARLLLLSHRVVGINNTFRRFEKLAELEPQHESLFLEAGKAYEILMRMRALEGFKSQGSGRYIAPGSLGKLQRQLLKNTFAPIDEIQKIIRVRFQVDYLLS
ncbi:DUF294 nucleotidyltransferase-like domain-containing protein [Pararhodonellum marinum]|uniref:DUF294 nucleotidyltransferase-like domain-containing protein n=1 Tax=Pararhodonellum marinum TaxID=2755358 RepID=UPI001890193D|nr:DUF294 nucleotidyltransferase-like domain-containing protein [Pararhodonellum marinum]